MPIIKSAIKRTKQTTKRRERNVGIKQDIKSATKAFIAKPTATTLAAAQSELDIAVKKGLLKKNTVARRKAQLHVIAKKAGVKLATKTTKKPVTKPVAKTTVAKSPAKKSAAIKKPVAKTATVKKLNK
jgi:ribosomal protein S20